MSDEDIQFDDVTYREPHKARRPDFERKLACSAYMVPGAIDLPIFLDLEPADAIERHALRDVSVELGGILLGKECIDEETGRPFVWVTESIEAKHYENTQASFTYTHDSWEEITRERDAKHPDLDIVGWYHTHPDFGIFLSGHDLFIHHNFFAQPLQVAYVVDPIRQTRGFFQWRDGQMVQVGGFHLTAPRADRPKLARFVNELEGLPSADGGGGSGMSPRLEAELIAMLSRPHTVAAATDRSQTAAIFTLIGVFLASLVFAGAYWLQTIGKGVQDQAKAIEMLAQAQEKAAAASEKSLGSERVRAKEEALDSLLRDVKIDPAASPAKVLSRLTEANAKKDEAVRAMERIRTEKEALVDKATALDGQLRLREREYENNLAKVQEDEKRARAEQERLEGEVDSLKKDLEAKAGVIQDDKTGELLRRYNWSWYLALIGWIGFLLCGVGLGAVFARQSEEAESRSREVASHDPEPPHQIT